MKKYGLFDDQGDEFEMPKFEMPKIKFELPEPVEKIPSFEEIKWNTRLPDHSKAILGANGVNPYNFKSEKERHDGLKSKFGNDNSVIGNSLDRAYGPDSMRLPSLDGMLDRGRADMAIMWGRSMDLAKKA